MIRSDLLKAGFAIWLVVCLSLGSAHSPSSFESLETCSSSFLDQKCSLAQENKMSPVPFTVRSVNYLIYLFWAYSTDFSPEFMKMETLLSAAQKVVERDEVLGQIQETSIQGKHFELSTACTDSSTDCFDVMTSLVSQLESLGVTADIRTLSFHSKLSDPHRIRKPSGTEVSIVDSLVFEKKLSVDHYNKDFYSQAYGIYQWASYHPERQFVDLSTLLEEGNLVNLLKAVEYQRNRQDKPSLFFKLNDSNFFNSFMVLNPSDASYIYEKIALIFVDWKVIKRQYSFTKVFNYEDMEFLALQTQVLSFIYRSKPLETSQPLVLHASSQFLKPTWDPKLYKKFREEGNRLKSSTFHLWDQRYMEHYVWLNNEYKDTFDTPHLNSYRWMSNPNAKNAALAFAYDLSKNMLDFSKFFFVSFKKYYPDDDLIIYGDSKSVSLLREFAKEIQLKVTFHEPESKMHDTRFSKYNNLLRGANYFYWLKNNKDYKNVFFVDLVDIHFQGNVFDDIPDTAPYLQFNYLDQFDVFKISFKYDSWVKIFMISDKLIRYFGAYQARDYEKEHMLCGGTIIGDPTSLLTLYTILNNMAEAQDFDSKSDQVFLVFTMFHYGFRIFNNVNIIDNGNKIFMFKLYPDELCNNCHLMTQKNATYYINGYERAPRVIHKLNRFFDTTRRRLMSNEYKRLLGEYMEYNFGKYAKQSSVVY